MRVHANTHANGGTCIDQYEILLIYSFYIRFMSTRRCFNLKHDTRIFILHTNTKYLYCMEYIHTHVNVYLIAMENLHSMPHGLKADCITM